MEIAFLFSPNNSENHKRHAIQVNSECEIVNFENLSQNPREGLQNSQNNNLPPTCIAYFTQTDSMTDSRELCMTWFSIGKLWHNAVSIQSEGAFYWEPCNRLSRCWSELVDEGALIFIHTPLIAINNWQVYSLISIVNMIFISLARLRIFMLKRNKPTQIGY